MFPQLQAFEPLDYISFINGLVSSAIIFHCLPVPQNSWETFSRGRWLNPKVISVEKNLRSFS